MCLLPRRPQCRGVTTRGARTGAPPCGWSWHFASSLRTSRKPCRHVSPSGRAESPAATSLCAAPGRLQLAPRRQPSTTAHDHAPPVHMIHKTTHAGSARDRHLATNKTHARSSTPAERHTARLRLRSRARRVLLYPRSTTRSGSGCTARPALRGATRGTASSTAGSPSTASRTSTPSSPSRCAAAGRAPVLFPTPPAGRVPHAAAGPAGDAPRPPVGQLVVSIF